jgi:transcriptional antiterminator NusG
LVEYLKSKLDEQKYRPFILTKEAIFWNKGQPTIFEKPLFPGYIIIETCNTKGEVLEDIQKLMKLSESKIYKILSYDNKLNGDTDIMLRESEQAMWESLVDSDFCIRASEATFDNGKIKVTSGPLVGKEARIKAINKYKRKVVVDVEFSGQIIETGLVLRIIK